MLRKFPTEKFCELEIARSGKMITSHYVLSSPYSSNLETRKPLNRKEDKDKINYPPYINLYFIDRLRMTPIVERSTTQNKPENIVISLIFLQSWFVQTGRKKMWYVIRFGVMSVFLSEDESWIMKTIHFKSCDCNGIVV